MGARLNIGDRELRSAARHRTRESLIQDADDLLVKNYDDVFHKAPTLRKFFESQARVKFIIGPIGSGKTYTCALNIGHMAASIPPASNNVRYSRFLILRPNYSSLDSAVFKTWKMMYPEEIFGAYKTTSSPREHVIWKPAVEYKDRIVPGVKMEIAFWAIKSEGDWAKVLSTEYTGIWLNEVQEAPKQFFDLLLGRVGRYPGPSLTNGKEFVGQILGDANPPHDDHWISEARRDPMITGDKADKGFKWEIYQQPPAISESSEKSRGSFLKHGKYWRVNPRCENIHRMGYQYYKNAALGSDWEFFQTYLRVIWIERQRGKPVFQEYKQDIMEKDMEPDTSLAVRIGVDFGIDSGIVVGQRTADGRWLIFDEYIGTEEDSLTSARMFVKMMREKYPWVRRYIGWADPSGMHSGKSVQNTTHYDMYAELGVVLTPCDTNLFEVRRTAGAQPMLRKVEEEPCLIVNQNCPGLRKALRGGYYYHDKDGELVPNKRSKHSHIGDAYSYLMRGAGEGTGLTVDRMGYNPHNRRITPSMTWGGDFRELV